MGILPFFGSLQLVFIFKRKNRAQRYGEFPFAVSVKSAETRRSCCRLRPDQKSRRNLTCNHAKTPLKGMLACCHTTVFGKGKWLISPSKEGQKMPLQGGFYARFQQSLHCRRFQKKDYFREANGSSAGSTDFHHAHD